MRKPDETTESEVQGIPCTVETWCDWTDVPWDGDEPLEENAEGYDVCARVTIALRDGSAVGHDSLGGIWILPDASGRGYLASELASVVEEAKEAALEELKRIAGGERLCQEADRMSEAKALLAAGAA